MNSTSSNNSSTSTSPSSSINTNNTISQTPNVYQPRPSTTPPHCGTKSISSPVRNDSPDIQITGVKLSPRTIADALANLSNDERLLFAGQYRPHLDGALLHADFKPILPIHGPPDSSLSRSIPSTISPERISPSQSTIHTQPEPRTHARHQPPTSSDPIQHNYRRTNERIQPPPSSSTNPLPLPSHHRPKFSRANRYNPLSFAHLTTDNERAAFLSLIIDQRLLDIHRTAISALEQRVDYYINYLNDPRAKTTPPPPTASQNLNLPESLPPSSGPTRHTTTPPRTSPSLRCNQCRQHGHVAAQCQQFSCSSCHKKAPGHYKLECPLFHCPECHKPRPMHTLPACPEFICKWCRQYAPGHMPSDCSKRDAILRERNSSRSPDSPIPDFEPQNRPYPHYYDTNEEPYEYEPEAMANMTDEPYY
jgi:hypothetical protein